MKAFDAEKILQEARNITGLVDFVGNEFAEAFNQLISSINIQCEISEERWEHLHNRFLTLLLNRLWMGKDLSEHPEIHNEQINSPIIIVSLPRTGSTKLHRMLGASPDFQRLTMWQTHRFARIPGEPEGGVDKRVQQNREYEHWMQTASPDILSGHPMLTDEPEEDQWLSECTFRQPMTPVMLNAPEYSSWLMQQDPQPVYDFLLLQLKYMQWQNRQLHGDAEASKPWLLKSPNHLGMESFLTGIFANPRFIYTHRDPVEVAPSGSFMVRHFRRLYSDQWQLDDIGDALVKMVAQMATLHLQWRNTQPDLKALDLSFKDITFHGDQALRQVYSFLNLPLSEQAEKAMARWETNNRQNKHGKNSYSLSEMGMTPEDVRTLFAGYIAQYQEYL
ncbi:MAG: hypothetical protein ACI9FD_000891 [Gammaproteobacteria bacterium]